MSATQVYSTIKKIELTSKFIEQNLPDRIKLIDILCNVFNFDFLCGIVKRGCQSECCLCNCELLKKLIKTNKSNSTMILELPHKYYSEILDIIYPTNLLYQINFFVSLHRLIFIVLCYFAL